MSEEFKKALRHPVHKMYSVSKQGNVYSHKSSRKLKPFLWGDSKKRRYRAVCVDGKQKKVCVLVLETYVGKRPKYKQAAHLDGDPLNDKLTNLMWVTQKENERHKKDHGTAMFGSKNPAKKLTEKDVYFIRKYYMRTSYKSSNAADLAKKFGVSRKTITNIVRGNTWR